MKSARKITFLSLAALCCLMIFGCGKEDGAGPSQTPTDTPPTKVDAGTGKMTVEQLRAGALKCKADLEAKIAEGEKIAQELMKSLANDNAAEREELNKRMAELNKESDALAKQHEAYVAQIKAKGGDVSDLEVR